MALHTVEGFPLNEVLLMDLSCMMVCCFDAGNAQTDLEVFLKDLKLLVGMKSYKGVICTTMIILEMML